MSDKELKQLSEVDTAYISFALMYALDNYPDFFYQSKDIKSIIIKFAKRLQDNDTELRMKQAFVSIREDIKNLYESISGRDYSEDTREVQES